MKYQPHEKEHIDRLRPELAGCAVLLKKNGAFPLKNAGKVALYGSGARQTVMGGTGSGEVNSHFTVTVEKGLEAAGFMILTKDWLDAYDEVRKEAHKQFIHGIKAKARATHTNAIVASMGEVMAEPEYDLPLAVPEENENGVPVNENEDAVRDIPAVYVLARISGEGNDRSPVPGDVLLTKSEIRDILYLNEHHEKFILVLNTGGPVDLSPVMEAGNILVLSQLGALTGIALVDILTGREAPSGKLTTTWTAWEDYPQIGDFEEENDVRYREGIYVGYRYFDSAGVKPLFPFGYGLGFTEFSVSSIRVDRLPSAGGSQQDTGGKVKDTPAETEGGAEPKDTVQVTARIKNIGDFPGRETLQIYVSVPEGKLDQPYQALAGFAKTGRLIPGEEEEVRASFRLSELASFSEADDAYILEAGEYIVRAGTSSADTQAAGILRVEEEIMVRKVRDGLGRPDFTDWRPERTGCENGSAPAFDAASADLKEDGSKDLENLPVLCFSKEDILTEVISYEETDSVLPEARDLSDEELIYLTMGSFDPKGSVVSVIGSAGHSVAGAAGETTDRLKEKGIDALVMADGPAGVRIAKHYFEDKKGLHGIGPVLPFGMGEMLPKPVSFVLSLMEKKPKRGTPVKTQYATALPIGTAVAQSWDTEFARMCGDIVGREMELFGIHLWLAPALNIHRSILCGRNFEYYSEDPLVGGKMAAAVTKGVQSHPGRGVTIKHYAANNQEFKRYTNNSIVSRRAMRDIYLRGFGICVREAQPHAVMTSYNLLNGIHTSERGDLVGDVLRHEFGFNGLVMTDWTIAGMGGKNSAYPEARADRVGAAGVDLFMPGMTGDFKNMKSGLAEGSLTREQLEVNASHVVRMIRKLR